MGWDRTTAREYKGRAHRVIEEALGDRPVNAAVQLGGAPIGTRAGAATVGIAIGLRPLPDGSFGLAVRYRLGTPTARMAIRRVLQDLGVDPDAASAQGASAQADVEVRQIGRVRALRPAEAGSPGLPPPIPTTQAAGETGRVRPLRPGISVAHGEVSAGTLGGFVVRGEDTYLLSNHHVLVGDSGEVGDPILQPGPYDGGTLPEDRAGELAAFVELTRGENATVDAALASIDGQEVDLAYPAGVLGGTGEVSGGEDVEKVGRTTGITRGRVTAIELDGVLVDFGPVYGVLSFDGQIEVETTGDGPFSQGGDSGSVVYRPQELEAVGLLFAGSDQGGSNGQGLTFLNPIDTVLTALEATWPVPGNGNGNGGNDGGGSGNGNGDGGNSNGDGSGGEPGSDPGEDGGPGDTDGGGGGSGTPTPLTQDDARVLARAVRSAASGVAGVTGVGLHRVGPGERGYAVVVNVTAEDALSDLPPELRGAVLTRVIGAPRALGGS